MATVVEEVQVVELQNRGQPLPDEPERQETLIDTSPRLQELKPVDRGWDAWVVLIAGFVIEALFWGFPMSFGVFQRYYSTIREFQHDRSQIALIGTICQGCVCLGSPFAAALTKRFPVYQRWLIVFGWFLAIMGLLAASFCSSVSGLIGTQGLMYGLGFVTLNYPILSMINEWWVARKGMAFGLISSASGATGAAMPFILESLLDKYGYRTTLRASAVTMFVLTVPLLPLFKARLPPSETASLARTDWSFLKRPLFFVYGSSILVAGLGFYFPTIFLPSYAESIGISPLHGALLLALMSIAQVLGQFCFGFLSDQSIPVSVLGGTCCAAASISALAVWGTARSIAPLVVFSLLYGFFGFGFGAMRVPMGRAISNDSSTVYATFAIFVFFQGIGNILVGPLSAALLKPGNAQQGFGTGPFDGIIILTGSTYLLAGLVIVGWHGLERLRTRTI